MDRDHLLFKHFFDTETTGTTANDEVIQLGYIVVNSNREVVYTYEKILQSEKNSSYIAFNIDKKQQK
jgi:DNA polymerase III epsilon subunit-like protein